AGGAARRLTGDNPGADKTPRYSPDGRFIAYRSQATAGFESDRWRLMLYDRQANQTRELLPKFDAHVESIAFAPDGRAGFAFYAYPYGDEDELPLEESHGEVATVEVFDPSTMQTARRFKLPDPALAFDAGSLAMNADGSELYLLDHAGQRLVVVETQAGGVVREVLLGGEATRWFALQHPAAGGAGPLIRYWEQNGDEDHHGTAPRTLRLDGWRAVPDDSDFAFTAEAGGTLYAVNDNGTRLFTLDADRRPRSNREINRTDDLQTPVGLFATPDGSRLILLLAIPEGGC
ncbi:MAG: hypothetical protein M3416_09700, partial [Acidobacteriota bacterium]|nr:hypothetical protein [Acidobacteriota bacterium]